MDFAPLRVLRLSLLGLFVAVLPLAAQTPPDYNALLQRLEQLKEDRLAKVSSALQGKQRELDRLIQSPNAAVRAYQQAHRYQHFAGKEDEKELYNQWKAKFKELHDEDLFEDAVTLHLRYLQLTLDMIQAPDQAKQRKENLSDLMEYLQAATKWDTAVAVLEEPVSMREAAEKKKRQGFQRNQVTPKNIRQLMKTKLAESPFVKEYQLEEHVKGVEEWEETPGNLDGILDKTVFPILRKDKDPRLLELWSERIERRERQVRRTQNVVAIDRFINVQKPQLLWRWSQDMLVLGQKGKAFNNMITVLEEYPGHAKYDDWMKDLTNKLKAESQKKAPPGGA